MRYFTLTLAFVLVPSSTFAYSLGGYMPQETFRSKQQQRGTIPLVSGPDWPDWIGAIDSRATAMPITPTERVTAPQDAELTEDWPDWIGMPFGNWR